MPLVSPVPERLPFLRTRNVLGVGGAAAWSNQVTEKSVLASALTIKANTLVLQDAFNIRASGTWLNNTAATQTLTLKIKVGANVVGSLVTSAVAASASTHGWLLVAQVKVLGVGGSGVFGGDGILYLLNAGADTVLEQHINVSFGAIASTIVDEVLDITATMSTATATSTVTPSGGAIESLPFNA